MQRVVEPGLFDVMVGGSSAQVQTVVLEVSGTASHTARSNEQNSHPVYDRMAVGFIGSGW